MPIRKPIQKTKPSTKKPWILAILLFVFLTAIITSLELTNTTHFFHTATPVAQTTGSQATKGEPSSNTPASSGKTQTTTPTTNTTEPGDSKSATGGTPVVDITAPTGNFVSAHHVPLTAAIASVCNTTVGANCQITFTSGGITQSLPVQPTDRGGSVYWNSWTPKSIGLTVGTWQIQAIATLGSQSQTASDATSLEVTQ